VTRFTIFDNKCIPFDCKEAKSLPCPILIETPYTCIYMNTPAYSLNNCMLSLSAR